MMLTLSLAGCKSAAQQFRDELAPVQAQAGADRAEIAASLQAASLRDASGARHLGQEIAALSGAVDQMAQLKAPGTPAEAAFVRYIAAYRSLISALERVSAVIAHGSAAQLRAASAKATDAAGAVQRASDALQAALGS